MIQNVLRDIGGIGLYGVLSVCLFFAVFSVALIRACLLKKPFLKSMSALPLDDGSGEPGDSRSADFQTAVSQVSNLRRAPNRTRADKLRGAAPHVLSRLQAGDTAGWKPALQDRCDLPTKGVSHS